MKQVRNRPQWTIGPAERKTGTPLLSLQDLCISQTKQKTIRFFDNLVTTFSNSSPPTGTTEHCKQEPPDMKAFSFPVPSPSLIIELYHPWHWILVHLLPPVCTTTLHYMYNTCVKYIVYILCTVYTINSIFIFNIYCITYKSKFIYNVYYILQYVNSVQ